ncbi:MAG: nucleotidyltransferase domain-containing protein [Candidatus Methanodesulfokora sp.]|jgi:predicted nucleotidyltransferase|nr:MAG: hypothetical protein C0200_06190 [Candidatus Korarchaeota archaeon]
MRENEALSYEDVRDVMERLRDKLRGKVREAYIIGSVAGGYAIRGESDLDLLIVPEGSSKGLFNLMREEVYLLLDRGLSLDLIVADNETYSHLIKEARKRGIRLI